MQAEHQMEDQMASSTLKPTAAVLTVSDSCSRGERADLSGPAVSDVLNNCGFDVVTSQIVPDDLEAIQQAILELRGRVGLVLTTGGTGIAPRDVTSEATRAVCDRLIEGIPERMRFEGSKKTSFAALSRGVCGVSGQSLILNLPGSPKGAVESLTAVIDLLPHVLQLIAGNTEHQ